MKFKKLFIWSCLEEPGLHRKTTLHTYKKLVYQIAKATSCSYICGQTAQQEVEYALFEIIYLSILIFFKMSVETSLDTHWVP